MRRVIPVFLLVLFVPPLQAQNPQAPSPQPPGGEYGPAGPPPPSSSFNFIVPLPSSRSLSAAQLAGKKLFVQRCSACHLPGNPAYSAFAPLLDGKLVVTRGEAAFREIILRGFARMPGFQYVFEPADVDKILGYLKTLTYDPSARKYTYSSPQK